MPNAQACHGNVFLIVRHGHSIEGAEVNGKAMIRIGMMVNALAPWPLGRLIKLDRVDLMLLAPAGINWQEKTTLGLHLESGRWVQRRSPLPQAVYNRCYSEQRSVIAKLEQLIGEKHIFNHVTRFDKWEIDQVLRIGGLGQHLPSTLLFDARQLERMLAVHAGVVIKPRLGQSGQGVTLLRKTEQGDLQAWNRYALESQSFSLANRPAWDISYIMQAEIPILTWNESVFDLRLLLQKDGSGSWQVSGDLCRVAVPGVFVTNVCKQITPGEEILVQVGHDPQTILDQLETISLQVASVLEEHFLSLGEISVDFALDTEGRIWIIEVNGKPDRKLFFALRDEELIQRILVRPLEYACYLAQQS